MDSFLIYGSYGYTGQLIAEQAVREGLEPILAGRNLRRLEDQAQKLGLAYRHFSLDDSTALDKALGEVKAVLHCAGPFSYTTDHMVQACLRARRHYVDISGELDGFEMLAALHDQARQAGIMLLPGAGFDVVPSDCLSAYLGKRLPNASHLRLFLSGAGSGISRGTARSALDKLDHQGRIRKNGRIIEVPPAWRVVQVDFGRGLHSAVSIGWGDVSTAYYSTGIPNIETYLSLSPVLIRIMVLSRLLKPVLASRMVKEFFKWLAGWIMPPGPTEHQNRTGKSWMIGEVTDGERTLRAKLQTPAGYRLTALTALEIIKRILSSDLKHGFQTPSKAYGSDFILQFPGVSREDLIK